MHLAAELPPPATDKEYTGQVKLGGKPVKDLGASGPSKGHPWDPYDSTKSLREWLGVGVEVFGGLLMVIQAIR